jgi:hypothetical protein
VRLSDLMRGAPLGVLEACAALLLARLYRRCVPREMRDIYRVFFAEAFHAPQDSRRASPPRAPLGHRTARAAS